MTATQLADILHASISEPYTTDMVHAVGLALGRPFYPLNQDLRVPGTTATFTSLPPLPVLRAWLAHIALPAATPVQTNHREHDSGGGYALLVDTELCIQAIRHRSGTTEIWLASAPAIPRRRGDWRLV